MASKDVQKNHSFQLRARCVSRRCCSIVLWRDLLNVHQLLRGQFIRVLNLRLHIVTDHWNISYQLSLKSNQLSTETIVFDFLLLWDFLKWSLSFQISNSRRNMQQPKSPPMGLHHDPSPTVSFSILFWRHTSSTKISFRQPTSFSTRDQLVNSRGSKCGKSRNYSLANAVGSVPRPWHNVSLTVERFQRISTKML